MVILKFILGMFLRLLVLARMGLICSKQILTIEFMNQVILPGDTLFQEFDKPNNGHWSKVGEAFIGTGSIDSLIGLSHSYIVNSWERDSLYREMQDDFNSSDITTFSNFEEFEGSSHSSGDLIDGRDATHGLSILAHDGDDTVYGSAYSDTFSDGDGDDTIYGMGGDDTFIQGLGGDTIDGGAGTDTLIIDYSRDLPEWWTDDDFKVINLQKGFLTTLDDHPNLMIFTSL